MAKKELTITEFRAIIKEEALKLKSRMVLENEKKALKEELKNLMNESCMEECGEMGEMDEIFGGIGKKIAGAFKGTARTDEAMRKEIMMRYGLYKKGGHLKTAFTQQDLDAMMAQATADNNAGKVSVVGGALAYIPWKDVPAGSATGQASVGGTAGE